MARQTARSTWYQGSPLQRPAAQAPPPDRLKRPRPLQFLRGMKVQCSYRTVATMWLPPSGYNCRFSASACETPAVNTCTTMDLRAYCSRAGVKIAKHLQVVPAIPHAAASQKAATPEPVLADYQRMNLRNALMSLKVAAHPGMHQKHPHMQSLRSSTMHVLPSTNCTGSHQRQRLLGSLLQRL